MQQHYDNIDFQKFHKGEMSKDELIAFAEHLLYCDDCNIAFAEFVDEEDAVSPPSGLSESVLRTAKERNHVEFFKYCVKVTAAACFAISVLFSGVINVPYNVGNKVIEEQFVDKTSIKLEEFKNILFFREADYIDKTK